MNKGGQHPETPPTPPRSTPPAAPSAPGRLRADTDDAGMEQLALVRKEVRRADLVRHRPAAAQPRRPMHDTMLRDRRARHTNVGHPVQGGDAQTRAQTSRLAMVVYNVPTMPFTPLRRHMRSRPRSWANRARRSRG